MQNEHMTRVAQMMGEHLEKTAALYERALNPPVVPITSPPVTNDWRMDEAEEDARYQFDNQQITQEQLNTVLEDIAKSQNVGFDLG